MNSERASDVKILKRMSINTNKIQDISTGVQPTKDYDYTIHNYTNYIKLDHQSPIVPHANKLPKNHQKSILWLSEIQSFKLIRLRGLQETVPKVWMGAVFFCWGGGYPKWSWKGPSFTKNMFFTLKSCLAFISSILAYSQDELFANTCSWARIQSQF